MKPHRIILVRHGECHANTDESKFATEPDYTIELTENGIRQAYEAGLKLKELVENETMYFYVSPFWRTRSTFENIVRSFPRSQFEYSEEPRLREQEWGYLRTYAELKQLKRSVRNMAFSIIAFLAVRPVRMYTTVLMIYWDRCIGISSEKIILVTAFL